MSKYIVKNCPAYELMRNAASGTYFNICGNAKGHIKCCDINDCVIKRIVGLCKDVKEKDLIVAERDKRTGEIISIGGWTENPVYDFAQKILQVLEIEEVNEQGQ